MKTVIHKSSIPDTRIYVAKQLNEKHFDATWHSHPEYQLFLVEEGTGTRFIGDSIHYFGPGELVFTGPHLPHLWRSDETYFEKHSGISSRGVVIYFNEHFLGLNILDKEEFIVLKKLFNRSLRGLEFTGENKQQIITLMRELVHLQGLETIIHLLRILLLLATGEYNYISPFSYQVPLNQAETERMNTVYEYVIKNYKRKIGLHDVAALLHMTDTSFSRYFSIINNKPFSRFITEVRIKNACKMLVSTEESVANICYECGFNTLSNFNNQFRSILAKTPLEYRKEYRYL